MNNGRLHTVEVENFKYFETRRVFQLHRFSAIIGQNGSGKSVLIEAIAFVLGETPNNLGVQNYTDLINEAAETCSVSLLYEMVDGTTRKFTRAVTPKSCEEYLNNVGVSRERYLNELKMIKAYDTDHNFIIYNHLINNVSRKNEKELCEMFENVSKSNEFKTEYNRLKIKLKNAKRDIMRMKMDLNFENENPKLLEHILKNGSKEEVDCVRRLEQAENKKKELEKQFKVVKSQRCGRFNKVFRPVAESIDGIYKGLTNNQNKGAYLDLENEEEPYLGGVELHLTTQFDDQSFLDLPGGDKKLAELALNFAILSWKKPPFVFIDNVDSTFHETTSPAVVDFLTEKSHNLCQIVVVSQRDHFYGFLPANTVIRM